MVREIREGNSFTISTDKKSIKISYPTSFGKGPVTYSLSSTTVNRDGSTVIKNVKTLEFTFTDSSKVHILLEVDVDNDGKPDITLNTDVNLRNYGL